MEFLQQEIPTTQNSVDTEFLRHTILPPPPEILHIFLYFHIFKATLCYLFSSQLRRNSVYKNTQNSVEVGEILGRFADFKSQSLQYV
jgi:hypothetical protein